jgi:Phage integrase family
MMPRKPKKEPAYFTEQEIEAFFRVIYKPRDKALFRIMYHHGLRASEAGKLMLSDYRPGPGKPRLRIVRLKGGVTGVEHTLLDLELAALRAWLRVRGTAPGPLFGSRKNGPVGRHQVLVLMKRYSILAAIPLDKAHPHALRHSCATHAAKLLRGDLIEIRTTWGMRTSGLPRGNSVFRRQSLLRTTARLAPVAVCMRRRRSRPNGRHEACYGVTLLLPAPPRREKDQGRFGIPKTGESSVPTVP